MNDGPRRRRIASNSKPLDVSESASEAILNAIYDAGALQSFTNEDSNNFPRKAACISTFVDPITGEQRWAVECWSGLNDWAFDFRDEADARQFFREELSRLGI